MNMDVSCFCWVFFPSLIARVRQSNCFVLTIPDVRRLNPFSCVEFRSFRRSNSVETPRMLFPTPPAWEQCFFSTCPFGFVTHNGEQKRQQMNLELTSVIACHPFNYVGDPGGQIDAWKKHGYDKNGSATILFD